MAKWGEVFAGAGLGLLVGVLMGLSVASVVGGVVAALSAGLAAFLGLVPATKADQTFRIGAFGLACVAGVFAGLAVRTGSAGLAPSVRSDVQAWVSAGYPEPEARKLVAFQRLGVKPASLQTGPLPTPGPGNAVLFSDTVALCSRLTRLPDDEALAILRSPSAGPAGAGIAAAIDTTPAAARPTALQNALAALCR